MAAVGLTRSEVAHQLQTLYFHADPAAKQCANSYLMRFQEDPAAWAVAQELLGDPAPYVQFMGAQTVYLKVKRQWNTLPEKAVFIARLFAYLRDGAGGALQAQTCLRLSLCISALVVRTVLDGWQSAIEDIIQFGRQGSVQHSRYLATQMLTAVPEELQDLPHMSHVKSSPTAQVLVAKVNVLVAFVQECIDEASDNKTGGLQEMALQCLVQWTKALDVRFCESPALSQSLVQLLPSEALTESLLEAFVECLQNSAMASSVWKVKDWPTEAPSQRILANGAEGMCLRALLDQLRVLHPGLEQLCLGTSGCMDSGTERRICMWARVVVMFCESYTQLLFEEDFEFLLRFLGCCFRLSPATAQPVFEFWGQIKEMQREELLSSEHVKTVLLQLTEPCVVSLLRYVRRDSAFSVGAPEDLSVLRDMAKDVACDVYCLWQKCDAGKADEFVGFLSEQLIRALDGQDALSAESALILFEGITDVLESPLPASFLQALQKIPTMPDDSAAMGAAAVLLQQCAPHMNAHVEILPGSIEFLMRALPAIPHTAADCILELTGYAGHHLTPSLPAFLAAVERVAPNHPPKVDSALYSAVVCTIRRLPASGAPPAFVSILRGTLRQLVELDGVVESTPGRLPEAVEPQLYRLLLRMRSSIWTLEQTPEDPDGPPPTELVGRGAVAPCVLAALGPCWAPFARVVEFVMLQTPVAMESAPDLQQRRDASLDMGDGADGALEAVAVKLIRSCISASKSSDLDDSDAVKFARLLLHLLVAVVQRGPTQLHVLSLLAELVAMAPKHDLQDEFGSAFKLVCEVMAQRLCTGGAGVPLPDVAPLFELLVASSSYLDEALYGEAYFRALGEQLAVVALSCPDRDLNRAVLQFLLKYAMSTHPGAQQLFLQFVPQLVVAVMQNFHKWPAATRKHSSNLFSVLLEKHTDCFHTALLGLWRQPGTPGAHAVLSSDQRESCAQLFAQLRGPRLKAFLGDLAAVANGEQTVDVLLAYQMM